MNYDGWFKSIAQFAHMYRSLKKNKNILLRGDDGSRFDPNSMDLMASKRVQPFIPKADNSTNNQPNENGENTKLKALYNRQISN